MLYDYQGILIKLLVVFIMSVILNEIGFYILSTLQLKPRLAFNLDEHVWISNTSLNTTSTDASFEDIFFSHHVEVADINNYFSNPLFDSQVRSEKHAYRDIHNLNQELFCPIPQQHPSRSGLLSLLTHFMEQQFPRNCDERKFWIVEYPCSFGLFAMLRCWEFYLLQAHSLNRTLLFHGSSFWWPDEECQDKKHHCYFLPISNCSVDAIMHKYRNTSYIEYSPQSMKRMNLSIDQRVIAGWQHKICYVKSWPFVHTDSAVIRALANQHTISIHELQAMIINFFLRLQPGLEFLVESAVQQSLVSAGINPMLDLPLGVLSLAIRWGDKCLNWPGTRIRGVHEPGEMWCFDATQYMEIAKHLKALDARFHAIVVSSETKEIVDEVVKQAGDQFTVVVNVQDMMQGTSVLHEHERRLMLSILSTIRLHFVADHFLIASQSNWIMGIHKLATSLSCPALKYSQRHTFDRKRQNQTCTELVLPWLKKPESNMVYLPKTLYDRQQRVFSNHSQQNVSNETIVFEYFDRSICA